MIVFFVGQVLPGDPGRVDPRVRSPRRRRSPTLDRQLGLDRPLITQYWHWISHFVRAISGTSYQYQAPIGPLLLSALGRSLKLAAFAFVIVVPLGILGGVVAALNVGRPLDRVDQRRRPDRHDGPGVRLGDRPDPRLRDRARRGCRSRRRRRPGGVHRIQFRYLIMPAIPLVLILFGYIARMARAGTVEALDSDYARTATLKGLPARRDDPPPRAAQLAAADDHRDRHPDRLPDRRPGRRRDPVPLPGIGSLIYNAANDKDFPMLEAGVLVIGIVYMLATLVADIVFSLLNPRIRYWRRAE